MNKNTILFVAVFLTLNSHGQVSIAPEAGFQMVGMRYPKSAPPHSETKFAYKPSFRAGINVAVKTNRTVSIHGGLFYARKGYNFILRAQTFNKIYLDYIDVPLYVNVTILNKKGNMLFAGIGPYISYCLGGKSNLNLSLIDPSWSRSHESRLKVGNNELTDFAKPLDFGANVNLGFIFPTGLYLRAQYSLGLANVPPKGMFDNSIKNRAFGISVGYQLKTKPASSPNL